jgi:hypothetical protein
MISFIMFGSCASLKIILFVLWCRLLEYAVGQKTPGWKMQDVQQQALICNDKVPGSNEFCDVGKVLVFDFIRSEDIKSVPNVCIEKR